jgi:peptidoglycan/LPS O-acetylase OafA/YrhL
MYNSFVSLLLFTSILLSQFAWKKCYSLAPPDLEDIHGQLIQQILPYVNMKEVSEFIDELNGNQKNGKCNDTNTNSDGDKDPSRSVSQRKQYKRQTFSAVFSEDASQWQSGFVLGSVQDQQMQDVRSECLAMNLSSSECFHDCLYYNAPFSWIPLLLDQNDTNPNTSGVVQRMMNLYALSGGPFSYYDVGNPDMCLYSQGTYCYTPTLGGDFILMQHGCCLPGSCVGSDAVKVMQGNWWCYQNYHSIYSQMGDIPNICEPKPRELNQFGPIFVIFIFFLFMFLVIVASVLKQYYIEYYIDPEEVQDQDNNNAKKPKIMYFDDDAPKNKQINLCINRFVQLFNLQDICASFVAVRSKKQFNFLDGIRVWSMSWVIFGHSFIYFITAGASNMATLMPFMPDAPANYHYVVNSFYFLFAEYGFYSVDSFFFLSGFLGSFAIYRQIQKYGNKAISLAVVWIPMSYFSRLLRIMPMMLFTTAIAWQLSDQLPYGYHVTNRNLQTDACGEEWWSIVFFYQNFTLLSDDPHTSCMGQLWYIQVDMQMFMLLPWLVLLFQYKQLYGFIASFIPTLVCLIIRLYYGFYYDFSANQLYPAHPAINDGSQNDDSYMQPWTRMSVYFIGVSTMFLILMIQKKEKECGGDWKFTLAGWQYFLCMFVGGFTLASLVFWPFGDVEHAPNDRWSIDANAVYYALSRPAWGAGLALLTIGMRFKEATPQLSMIKRYLSLEIYQPIGKLTYTMYLIHMIIFSWWARDLDIPAYYTEWQEILLFIGIWTMVAVFTLILWMFMEKPLGNLATFITKSVALCCKQIGDKRENGNHNQSNDNNTMMKRELLFTDEAEHNNGNSNDNNNSNGHENNNNMMAGDLVFTNERRGSGDTELATRRSASIQVHVTPN